MTTPTVLRAGIATVVLLMTASASDGQDFKNGAVVSVSRPASEVGLDALKRGGNSVDAAIAAAFALAVTHPEAGNIGGGGFMLVRPPTGDPVVVDFREVAPSSVNERSFEKETSTHTHRAVAVPGTVRGLGLAHAKFAKLPWKSLVLPAATLARDGFVLDEYTAKAVNRVLATSKDFPEFIRVYSRPGGGTWKAGERMVLPDLAKTLERIAEDGPDAFYKGPLADLLVAEMRRGDGFITAQDLAAYRPILREPVKIRYRGHDILAPPLPSSGGPVLSLMCNMLEPVDLKSQPRMSAQTLHRLAETMRRAYFERALSLGDPAITPMPKLFVSRDDARRLAADINPDKATPSLALAAARDLHVEGDHTTHLSVADAAGWAVSLTYTLEASFGSRIVVPGAGYLLNNEMGDFNWKPGVTTTKGGIGTPANRVGPGKKMLSSQCPTIVLKDGKVRLVTGSPGGRTIPNTVFNILVNVIDYDMPVRDAVDAPRIHHQWLPDVLRMEKLGESPDTLKSLRAMGHTVVESKQGDAHTIAIDPATGAIRAAADRRLSGYAAGY